MPAQQFRRISRSNRDFTSSMTTGAHFVGAPASGSSRSSTSAATESANHNRELLRSQGPYVQYIFKSPTAKEPFIYERLYFQVKIVTSNIWQCYTHVGSVTILFRTERHRPRRRDPTRADGAQRSRTEKSSKLVELTVLWNNHRFLVLLLVPSNKTNVYSLCALIRLHSTYATVFLTARIRLAKKNLHHTVHSHLPDERTSGKLYLSIAGMDLRDVFCWKLFGEPIGFYLNLGYGIYVGCTTNLSESRLPKHENLQHAGWLYKRQKGLNWSKCV
ncbi:hypothetical protein T05_5336 [Trichinella murrelli]|uniref:Uncharacterized protein n=1 Tax=Trichinella murrelli TaxID=144512 RepID=A0A0V0UCS9_9BILA|nr:hypothetical protein T05_5336 [Trichinella murrelli]